MRTGPTYMERFEDITPSDFAVVAPTLTVRRRIRVASLLDAGYPRWAQNDPPDVMT